MRKTSGKPETTSELAPTGSWSEVGFAAFFAAYFVIYYASDATRQLRHFWLLLPLIPDELIPQWFGGTLARFGLLDRIPVIAAALLILVIAFVYGCQILLVLRAAAGLTRVELVVLACAVGLNVVSLAILALGLGGLIGGVMPLVALTAVAVALSAFQGRRWVKVWRAASWMANPQDKTAAASLLNRFSLSAGLIFGGVILLGGCLPPWHFDVREYHLQVPKEWYQQGAVEFLPHNVYGNMPLGAEMFTVLGMELMPGELDWWWGGLVGKVMLASFSLLAAVATYAVGARFFSHAAGVVAGLVFITTPWIAFVSMAGLNEGASALFQITSLLAILLWWKGERNLGLLAVGGFLAGAAVSCKYPALLFTVIPEVGLIAVLPLVDGKRKEGLLAFRSLVVFGIGVVVGCGLWFAKNIWLTGNPTYPLLYELFGGLTRTHDKHLQWSSAHRARGYSLHQLVDNGKQLLIYSDYTSPILMPFGLAALFMRQNRRLILVLASLLFFNLVAWWLLTHRVDRFLLPQLPLLAVLCGATATAWDSTFWKRFLFGVLIFTCLANLALIVSRSIGDNRFLVALNDLLEVEYEELGPDSPHMHISHVYLNQEVEPGYRVLICGDAQVFDLRMPIYYNTCFDDCVMEQLLADRTREERFEELKQRRISHVLVSWHELDRYRSPGNYGYSEFVTRDFVRKELVERQGLLREIPLPEADNAQLFEVVGWRDW